MGEVFVRRSKDHVDPKHPESHPDWNKAVDAGRRRLEKLKFESEGQKKDYERAVRGNPNNVPGLPPFYPELRIRTTVQLRDMTPEEAKKKEEMDLRAFQVSSTRLYCPHCHKETEHSISPEISFCKKCGSKARYTSPR